MPTTLISGGTGMIGRQITDELVSKGHQVIILTRGKSKAEHAKICYAKWDIEKMEIDADAISSADFIVHLAGAGIADKRWSDRRKAEIVNSRVNGSKLIALALATMPNKVRAVISASAIGWYGADPIIPNPKPFTEEDAPDTKFLGETCKLWEQSIGEVRKSGKRLVILRTGIVLSNEGGALPEFRKPLRFGLAPVMGNGKQVMSWIHIDDLVNFYITALEDESWKGVYNAVAPFPVSNKKFMMALARQTRNFFIPFPVPAFILKLILGEMSVELLKSTTVSSDRAKGMDFHYKFPRMDDALKDLLKK